VFQGKRSKPRANHGEVLGNQKQCVYLVPPQGPFTAQNYRSAAYSVSGKGFLPLEPISFGLAINISGDGDYMRLIMTCRKEGDKMFIHIDEGREVDLNLPLKESELNSFFENIYQHLLHWFQGRVDQYDNGSYGSNDALFLAPSLAGHSVLIYQPL